MKIVGWQALRKNIFENMENMWLNPHVIFNFKEIRKFIFENVP